MNQTESRKAPPPISLRLTPEERAMLEKAAAGDTLSAHIRERLFDGNVSKRKRRQRMPVKDEVALAQTLGLLGRSNISSNLNQLAKASNSGSLLLDDETEAKINEAYEHVVQMRRMLIRALGLMES